MMHDRPKPRSCAASLRVALGANFTVEFLDESECSAPRLRRVGEVTSRRHRVGDIWSIDNA
jgi:hypothetical protein